MHTTCRLVNLPDLMGKPTMYRNWSGQGIFLVLYGNLLQVWLYRDLLLAFHLRVTMAKDWQMTYAAQCLGNLNVWYVDLKWSSNFNTTVSTFITASIICSDFLPEYINMYYKVVDWLRAGRSGDRILVGARFFTHFQTSPGAHPAFCTMGTGSFPGVKWQGHGADHPPPSSAEVENE
jgi:hypothetical protein